MSRIPIRLRNAYMEEPVMIKDTDIFRHKDISGLPISPELKLALKSWDEAYQATFDSNYPPDSGFSSAALEASHVKEGVELARRIQVELGDRYSVEYKP